MIKRTVVASLALALFPQLAVSQTAPAPIGEYSQAPWGSYPKTQDPDPHRVDKFFGDWHGTNPRPTHGGLVERDILTRGDAMEPPRKSAVLADLNFYSYATLAARASTTPVKLEGQQEVFYILSGKGTITAGRDAADLYQNIAVLVPAGLEFAMKNTGDEPLTMYLINETIPAGFSPKTKLVVRDENSTAISQTDFTRNGHWAHIVKVVFERDDGLGVLGRVLTVSLDPWTIGEPHAHRPGQHEVWTAIQGESIAFVGTQIRPMTPGMAYQVRPDALMTHSNLNVGKEQVKFLWFVSGGRR
jgi:mannose-6-phosphate isomerase-like protein (cupin superfamily)